MKKHLSALELVFRSTRSKVYFTLFTLLYIFLSSVILGYNLLISFYATSVSLSDKIAVTPSLLTRPLQTQPQGHLPFHIVIAFLFALNLTLATTKIKGMKNPSIKFGIGAGIASLTVAGCASCGISLLTLVGLGSALTLLPFGGIEILSLTLLILLYTTYYNLNSLAKVCKI